MWCRQRRGQTSVYSLVYAERAIATASRLSARPSVRDVEVS